MYGGCTFKDMSDQAYHGTNQWYREWQICSNEAVICIDIILTCRNFALTSGQKDDAYIPVRFSYVGS